MLTELAAFVFCALALFAAGFQIALAMGMPWGSLTWGGKFPGRLPGAMRFVAGLSAALLLTFALVVAVRARMLLPEWQSLSRIGIWFVAGYSVVGVAANAMTPSPRERLLWLPVALVMLACCLTVASS
jgi:hypothetical protein